MIHNFYQSNLLYLMGCLYKLIPLFTNFMESFWLPDSKAFGPEWL